MKLKEDQIFWLAGKRSRLYSFSQKHGEDASDSKT